jgi:hypothetical protein
MFSRGGTDADAYCPGGVSRSITELGSWIEWYPLPENQISNFIVKAGDVMYGEV